VNWHRLFHDLIDDFSVEDLAKKQGDVCKAAGIAL